MLGRRLSNRCYHSINIQINANHNRNNSIASSEKNSSHSTHVAEKDADLVASIFECSLSDAKDDDFDDNEINLTDCAANSRSAKQHCMLDQNRSMDDSNSFVEEFVEKLKSQCSIQLDNDDNYNVIKKCRGDVFHSVYDDSNASSMDHNNSISNSNGMVSASAIAPKLSQDNDDANEEKDNWKIKKIFRNKKEERELEVALSLCFKHV